MKTHIASFKLLLVLAFVAMSSMFARPASAAVTTYFTITGVDHTSCTPGAPIAISFNYATAPGDTTYHLWTVSNPRAGTSDGPISVGPIGTGGPFYDTNVSINVVPPGTLPGDTLIQTVQATSTLGPGTTSSISFICNGGPDQTVFKDGRLNNTGNESGQTAAIYCENNGVTVYGYRYGYSFLAFKVSKIKLDSVPADPTKNVLIMRKNGISLYRLTTGELQVNAPGIEPAKGDYVFIFKGCEQ